MKATMRTDLKTHVRKIRNIEDEATGDAYIVFRIRKTCGRTGLVTVPREQADSAADLLQLFKRKNADLPTDEIKAKAIISRAILTRPLRHSLRVRHVGWRKGRKTFVLGRRIIGSRTGKLRIDPPLWIDDHSARSLRSRGTIEAWKDGVARPARYSSILRLAILAAFAAPLVRVSGLQNFALNIFGPSKVGKTTALLASTSTYGIGSEMGLPNWNSTSAAFMEGARGYNDLVLPGNEVGLIDGRRRDAYAVIRNRIYTFAEGRDRSRMSKASVTTPKYSASYRGIAVYTAEYSFEEYAMLAGEVRSQGEYARAIDVPAVRAGHTTIFDRYPKDVPASERQAWARAQLIKLRRACGRHHGTAIVPYIEFLMTAGDELPSLVRSAAKEFLEHVRGLRLDPALDHASRNFALLYAGGCLGIEAKVLPWSKDATLTAVLTCFEEAVRVIRSHENALNEAKRELKKRLASERIRPFGGPPFGPADTAGFRRKVKGSVELTIHSATFRGWFSNRIQAAAILRWLHDEGLLVLGNKATKPSSTATEWAERAPRWPDGTTQKSFVFRNPFQKPKLKGKG